MKADRKRLKGEKTDLVNQMQQLYATLESREEQLRDFIRNYEQHRKVGTPPSPDPPDSTGPDLEPQNTGGLLVPSYTHGGNP